MSVRLYSLEVLRQNWDGNPMGLVSYGTEAFRNYFVVGSNDDLGYMGNWYTFGWYCIPMIALMIAGYIWTMIKHFGKQKVEIIYAFTIYLCVTGISLSCWDLARVDVLPFFLFILQTWADNRDTEIST